MVEVGESPTVFLIDDDHGVRRALEALVVSAGFRAATFASGREFLAAWRATDDGCVVVDLCLADNESGLDVQEELARRNSQLPVIVITGFGTVPDSVRAFRGGALDFLQKPFSPQLLLERIGQAMALSRTRREARMQRTAVEIRLARLTRREREVLTLLETGRTSKSVAATMNLSVRTVEGYRREILRKLEVASVTHMVRLLAGLEDTPLSLS